MSKDTKIILEKMQMLTEGFQELKTDVQGVKTDMLSMRLTLENETNRNIHMMIPRIVPHFVLTQS